jgi:hypothetical protein
MTDKTKSVLKRFVKIFIAGGVAGLSTAFVATPSFNTLADLKMWMFTLITAFVSGGLAALEKYLNWQE